MPLKYVHQNLFETESARLWKERLGPLMPADWAREIDEFETEIFLKKQDKIENKVFAETRLRRGVYGQRYDNGKRHDGKEERTIPYPQAVLTKGPGTLWDAPGMLRIKIPYGGLNFEQMYVLADVAEEYSDGILHVTTRQDFQLHFIHIEDTPALFRRLAAVGITTREACGNTIRNITACPIAGVCCEEVFDVTPYAEALFRFTLGHPDAQDFGRKFKISFSGCEQNACALACMHDIGLIAVKRSHNSQEQRGFKMYVGGGLGALPFQAQLFSEFVSEEELLPLVQAICRVFARYGEKKKRNRARLKFLLSDWDLEKFRATILAERQSLSPDPRWTAYIPKVLKSYEHALPLKKKTTFLKGEEKKSCSSLGQDGFQDWFAKNVKPQSQVGYATVTIALPLGDISASQMRALANALKNYIKDTVRTTVEQNLLLRWVPSDETSLRTLYLDLKRLHLAHIGAGAIVDITACPGTDTCKLGVSSSRGLAGELQKRLSEKFMTLDQAVQNLHIKISGCFNSCGQHHLADIGFYGVSRKVGNYLVPHFQLVLGGNQEANAKSYGLAVMALPSKAIPQALDRLVELYVKERHGNEDFHAYIERKGKLALKADLEDLSEVPSYLQHREFYTDWSDVREYSKSDIGQGECAGEVVSVIDFGLKAADREIFAAQIALEEGNLEQASKTALHAMLTAAHGLTKSKCPDLTLEPGPVIESFRRHFCETQIFYDPFAGDKFANFFLRAYESEQQGVILKDASELRQRIEEAQLFIEAAHACNARLA